MSSFLFHATNGVGLGHQSRAVALARGIRRIEPDAEVLFLVESADVRLITEAGFPAYQVPSRLSGAYPRLPQWDPIPTEVTDSIWTRLVQAVVGGFHPNVVVFDTYIWPEIQTAAEEVGARQVAVMRRFAGMLEFVEREANELARLSLIIFPYEPDDYLLNLASRVPAPTYFAGTLLRRSRSDIDTEGVRERYGIDGVVPVVVATNGGGSVFTDGEFPETVLNAWRRLRGTGIEARLILVTGPLHAQARSGNHRLSVDDGVTIVEYEPSLLDLMALASVVVCRGGYNTIAEVLHLGVPTIAIPAPRRHDRQGERVRAAARESRIVEAELDEFQIASTLREMLQEASWQFRPDQNDEALERSRNAGSVLLKVANGSVER